MEPGDCDPAAPNPPCAAKAAADANIMAARSQHIGGVNVSLADGSVAASLLTRSVCPPGKG